MAVKRVEIRRNDRRLSVVRLQRPSRKSSGSKHEFDTVNHAVNDVDLVVLGGFQRQRQVDA